MVVDETIAVVAYDSAWPLGFEAERTLLERVLDPWLEGGVHHIGSTAIPGMPSKPIIDMMAGVRDLDETRGAFELLHAQSYLYDPHRPEISGARFFTKPSLPLRDRTHHLHLTESGSDLWRERLAFRDALRGDPALAAEYEALKLRLAQEHSEDVGSYTAGKRDFVVRVLGRVGIQLDRR